MTRTADAAIFTTKARMWLWLFRMYILRGDRLTLTVIFPFLFNDHLQWRWQPLETYTVVPLEIVFKVLPYGRTGEELPLPCIAGAGYVALELQAQGR